ncbi:hypothetical protein HYALB_00011370 [Hymenoscyphus albidus]|uniref:Gylcosyl hydrolase 115 C-terminal domain-containing protein n=1 Tax=Hymenoscyphus albidus TaxID=595503 RepID=A0A9N9Q2L7_9HELO|nr:hypothetical protein HYALB_00011370 [Hymenoscyphus albidus]
MPALKWPAASINKPPGVAIEGGNTNLELPSLNRYGPKSRWIEIYSTSNSSSSYKVESDIWVNATPLNGTIKAPGDTADQRVLLSINWETAPIGKTSSKVKITAGSTTATITLPIDNSQISEAYTGFVESNKTISIEPEHYTTATSSSTASYGIIPGYGRTLSGVTLLPITADSQTPPASPKLS